MTKFNDSFGRCINDPLFLDQFYAIFLASSDEISALFTEADIDTQKSHADDLTGLYERSRSTCFDSGEA